MASLKHHPSKEDICATAKSAIKREQKRRDADQAGKKPKSKAHNRWKQAIALALRESRSRRHYQEHLSVSTAEHMSAVDPFDGDNCRKGEESQNYSGKPEDLLVISPVIDGRLKDEGRPEQGSS
jgi:5'-nucleotidase